MTYFIRVLWIMVVSVQCLCAAQEQDHSTKLTPVEAPEDGVDVIVVDALTEKTIDGALVTWFPRSFDTWVLAPEPLLTDLRQHQGTTVRTDAQGKTRIARDASFLVANFENSYGRVSLPRVNHQALRVTLHSTRTVAVCVVDQEHKPVAGVPVLVEANDAPQGPDYSWHMQTGKDGCVRIAPIDLYFVAHQRWVGSISVSVDVLLKNGLTKTIKVEEIPDEPIVFVLPPTGRLVIDVVDDDGNPVRETHWVTAEVPDDTTPLPDSIQSQNLAVPESSWVACDETSHYVLPHVELGLAIQLSASGELYDSGKHVITGPEKPGHEVSVKIVCSSPRSIVAVIGDEGDRPLIDTEITVQVRNAHKRRHEKIIGVATTNENGRLRIPLSRIGDMRLSREKVLLCFHRITKYGPVASAEVPLPEATHKGIFDARFVSLGKTDLLASGKVVDDEGQPVSGASISVMASPTDEEMRGFSGSYSNTGEYHLRVTTDQDGSFQIFGLPPDGVLTLHAHGTDSKGFRYERGHNSVGVEPGTTDVLIELARTGIISGAIVGDPEEIEDLYFVVTWRRPDGTTGNYSGGDSGQHFELKYIPTSLATIELCRRGGSTISRSAVAKVENIEVKAGQTTTIDPIVLEQVEFSVELTVVDENGELIPEGWVSIPSKGESDHFADILQMMGPEMAQHFPRTSALMVFKEGRTTLRTPTPIAAFAIGAPSQMARVFRGIKGPQEVVLAPSPQIEIILEYEGNDFPANKDFILRLVPPEDDKDWFRFGPSVGNPISLPSSLTGKNYTVLTRNKPVPVRVLTTGRMIVELSLAEAHAGGFSGHGVRVTPDEIMVEEVEAVQQFRLCVDR